MANYDANIRVTANLEAAERSLKAFEARINKLAEGIDVGKKVGRSFAEAFVPPKQLKQLDKELAAIAGRADTVAKRFARVVEGVGTIGVAAKGISDVGNVLEQLSVAAQNVAGNFNSANAAARVLTPGFNLAKDTANALAKDISFLEYKFHALVPSAEGIAQALASIGPEAGLAGGAIAAIGTALETVLRGQAQALDNNVSASLRKITDQTQSLLKFLASLDTAIGGTVRQFQRLLRTGEERLANVSAYSDEARRAMSTILTAEMRLTQELERQAVLRREMQASRFANVAQRYGMSFDFSNQRQLPAAGQTSFKGDVVNGLGGGARTALRDYEMLVNAAGKLAARTQDSADAALRFAQATKPQIPVLDHFKSIYAGIAAEATKLSQVKALPSSEMLNASARGLNTISRIEELRLDRLKRIQQKLKDIANYESSPMANAGFGVQGPAVPPGGVKRRGGKGAKPAGMSEAGLNAILGGAFPALFGAGPGAIFGGVAGGAIGGAMGGLGGMALSIAFSALGQQLDQTIAKLQEIGNNTRLLNVDGLRDSFVFVNKELTNTVRLLSEAGRTSEARAAIEKAVADQTGLSAEAQRGITAEVNRLSNAWNQFLGNVSAVAGILSKPIIAGLASIFELVNLILVPINKILSALLASAPVLTTLTEEEQKRQAALEATLDGQLRELVNTRKILEIEKQRTLGRTLAEREINATLDYRIERENISNEYAQKRKQFLQDNIGLNDELLTQGINHINAAQKLALQQAEVKNRLVEQGLAMEANNEKYDRAAESVQRQIESLNRAGQVTQSRFSAESALNDLYGAQLDRQYELATTAQQRYDIAVKQFYQQVAAADIEYRQALVNNDLLVKKAQLEARIVEIKYQQIDAEKQLAIAQAISRGNTPSQIEAIRAAYDRVLKTQMEIVQASRDQVVDTVEVAKNQNIVADAIYKTKVIQAESRLAQKLTTEEIGLSKQEADRLAGSLGAGVMQAINMQSALNKVSYSANNAANAISKVTGNKNLNWEYDQAAKMYYAKTSGSKTKTRDQATFMWQNGQTGSMDIQYHYASGGYVNKPTRALIGEGGQGEYVIPESRASSFAMNYLLGARGNSALASTHTASPAQINIQTGPVLEFDGTRYVSVQDLERAMRVTADGVIGRLRTPAARIALGMR